MHLPFRPNAQGNTAPMCAPCSDVVRREVVQGRSLAVMHSMQGATAVQTRAEDHFFLASTNRRTRVARDRASTLRSQTHVDFASGLPPLFFTKNYQNCPVITGQFCDSRVSRALACDCEAEGVASHCVSGVVLAIDSDIVGSISKVSSRRVAE